MLKKLAISIISLLPINAFLRHILFRRCVSIVLYHDPGVERFRQHLDYFRQHYNIIPLATLVDALYIRKWETIPDKALVITFDDGLKSFYDLLPLLQETPVPITHFVVSDVVNTYRHFWFCEVADPEKYKHLPNHERLQWLATDCGYTPERNYPERQGLNEMEIQTLQACGVSFQSHSVTHPILPRCGDSEAVHEICASREPISQITMQPVEFFAYPNGDYSEKIIQHLIACDFRAARTTELGVNSTKTDPYRLRILQILDTYDLPRLKQLHLLTFVNAIFYRFFG